MPSQKSDEILFFGTLSVFSYAVLSNLLTHKINVTGVVVPGSAPAQSMSEKNILIPVLQQPQHDTVELLAIKHDIPVYYLNNAKSGKTFTKISALSFDFLLVACFPLILPDHLLDLPRIAALNIHPSMLPAYRGPAPLFWQLKDGIEKFAVTLHQLSQVIDGGNIILQKECSLPDGLRGRAIDENLGKLGSLLFIKALSLYARNRVIPNIQQQKNSSYQPQPVPADFLVSTDWTAKHAFNFMRGTADWNQPCRVTIDNRRFLIQGAIAWSPGATISEPWQIDDDVITLKFSQGLMKAGLKEA